MRLARVLPASLAVLFVLLLAGILAVAVVNSRSYLGAQMQTHAQDTATFLGLALSASARSGDAAGAETLVNAVFDRGYYSEISLRDIQGRVLISRTQLPRVEGVPAWFVMAVPLPSPAAQALVMDGWHQLGSVQVASHPGQAYLALWRLLQEEGMLIAVLSGAVFVLAVGGLYLALAPLRALTALAGDVARRRFRRLERLPWASELRIVAQAMNDMSGKVESMLGHQARVVATLRGHAYEDELTGLPNRRSLMDRLQHWARSEDEFHSGTLALVEITNLALCNARHGRKAGDALLCEAARRLQAMVADLEPALLARSNGAEFALIVGDAEASAGRAEALGARILEVLAESSGTASGPIEACVGLAHTSRLSAPARWLAAADAALLHAHDRGPGNCRVEEVATDDAPVAGAERWRGALEAALRDRTLVLAVQPVRGIGEGGDGPDEVLVRVPAGDGTLLPAGLFMPLVREAGLARVLDEQVLQRALDLLAQAGSGTRSLAVNLCAATLSSPGFGPWLRGVLAARPAAARRLVIELPERDWLRRMPEAESALVPAAGLGLRFAADRFGHEAAGLTLLRRIELAYVKIDGAYTRGIEHNADARLLVQTLAGVAHGLGVRVIAESVETAEALQALAGAGVDAVQGRYIAPPA